MAVYWRIPLKGILIVGPLLLVPVNAAWASGGEPPPPVLAAATEPATPAPDIIDVGIDKSDRMTVPIHIGGQGPYAFIVDTAATRTVISRELANKLNLKPAGRVNMLSLTGYNEAALVHVPKLMFQPGRTHDISALALGGTHIGAHGILGIDTLQNQRVVLDFKGRTLAVSEAPRRGFQTADPDEIIVTARRRFGQLILADSTIDDEKIDVIIDTGTQVSLGNDALRRRLLGKGRQYAVTPISIIGVTGGVLTADYTRVDQLRIGRVAMHGMPIAFADAYPFRKLKLRKPALLLGMDALSMFARVTLDFQNRKASFVLPEPPVTAPGMGR